MIGIVTVVVIVRKERVMAQKDLKRLLRKGPDLDKYIEGKKKKYTTYGLGASLYSLNYYTFVRLCKEAGANIQIKKNVIVDLDILDAYLESMARSTITFFLI